MLVTQPGPGRPAALNLSDRFVHVLQPSLVSQTAPSSVPAQNGMGLHGDSESAVPVPRLVSEISGDTACKSSPCFNERKT